MKTFEDPKTLRYQQNVGKDQYGIVAFQPTARDPELVWYSHTGDLAA